MYSGYLAVPGDHGSKMYHYWCAKLFHFPFAWTSTRRSLRHLFP